MKTLKTLFSSLAAVLLLAMAATVSVACGGDDDPVEQRVPTYANAMLRYVVAPELLDVVDITVKYIDGDEVKTEKLTTYNWTKSTKQSKIPTTVGFKITMKLRDGITLDKDEYTASYFVGDPFVGIFDQDGYSMNVESDYHWSSMDDYVSKEEFRKYVNDYCYEYVVNVKEGGKIEETTKDW